MQYDQQSSRIDDPVNYAGLRDGCADLYVALYREFWVPLHSYASRLVASSDDAADLAQEVLCGLYCARAKFCVRGSLAAYLFRAVRHRAINHRRHAMVHRRFVCGSEATDNDPSPSSSPTEKAITQQEAHRQLRLLLSRLPRRCRDVTLLVCRDGLSYRDAAVQLRVEQSTIRTHLLRARRLAHEMVRRGQIDAPAGVDVYSPSAIRSSRYCRSLAAVR